MGQRRTIAALLLLATIGASAASRGLSLRGMGRAMLVSDHGHARQLTTFGAVEVVGSGKGGKKVVQPKVPTIIEYQPVKVKATHTKKKDVQKVLDRTAKKIAKADARVAHVIAATEKTSKKKVAAAAVADEVAAKAVQVDALTGPLILPAVAAGAAVVTAKAKADAVINYKSKSAKKIAKAIKKAEKAKAKAKKKAAKQIAAIQAFYADQLSYDKVAYIFPAAAGKAVKSGGNKGKAATGIFLPPVLASAPALGPQAIPYLLKGVHDGAGPAPVLRVLSNFDEDAINDLNGLFIGDASNLLPRTAGEHLVLPFDLPDFDLIKAVGQVKTMAKAALEGLVEGTAVPGQGGLPVPLPANLVKTLVDLNPNF